MTTGELAAIICRNWYGLDDPRHTHPETISSITRLIDSHIAECEAELVERIIEEGWIGYQYVDAFRAARRKE